MKFFIVDVFGSKRYQGNQLAVFVLKDTLSASEMQQIAKEMNFSETSFILSGDKHEGHDVRIFTPDIEVPFAGHPSLGTAFIIHKLFDYKTINKIVLNLPIGKLPITITNDCIENEFWMELNDTQFGVAISSQTISDVLQIEVGDIDHRFPIQIVSTGLPAIIVPLQSLKALQKCQINHHHFQKLIDKVIKANVLVFCTKTVHPDNDLQVRVFMDDPGFLEDAATGSANANLAAYLLEHNFYHQSQINLKVEQGHYINRPSLIKMKAEKIDQTFRIYVGGKVFLIAEGTWKY